MWSMVNTFDPDWCTPPGGTIEDILGLRAIRYSEFAVAIGLSLYQLFDLLDGDLEIDYQLATQLAAVLGSTTEFWLAREADYRQGLASGKIKC